MLQPVIVCLSLLTAADPVEADHVIKNATIYDGSGQPGKKSDLATDRLIHSVQPRARHTSVSWLVCHSSGTRLAIIGRAFSTS